MPYSYPGNIPKVAKSWTAAEQKKCIAAANAVLNDGGSEQDAIFACIRAAGKTKNPGGEEKSSAWVDIFRADKVLAGEEILLVPVMPDGYVRGGVRRPPITQEHIQAIARNFQKRATSGFYQTIIPLNKEHEPTEGKIGAIQSVRPAEEGAFATLDLTDEGRQLLESGKFDYLSPEIRWKTIDIVTGEDLGASLAGAAATNYPYFGDRTAMYSQDAEERMAEGLSLERREGVVLDLVQGLTEVLRNLGWRIEDIKWEAERGDSDLPADSIVSGIQAARKSLMLVLAQAAAVLPDLHSQRTLLELFVPTKLEDDGQRYPRSAYAAILKPDDPSGWLARYRDYEGDTLVDSPDLLYGILAPIEGQLSGQEKDDAVAQILETCTTLGLDPEILEGNMGTQTQEPGAQDQMLAQYTERLSALEKSVETYRQQLSERDATIAQQGAALSALETQRLTERFTREAEGYNAIGAEKEGLADAMLWLYQADATKDKARYTYFKSLLDTVNGALLQSLAFNEIGHGRDVSGTGDPWRKIEAAVEAKAKARGVAAPVGSPVYSELMTELMTEQPGLFSSYRETLLSPS